MNIICTSTAFVFWKDKNEENHNIKFEHNGLLVIRHCVPKNGHSTIYKNKSLRNESLSLETSIMTNLAFIQKYRKLSILFAYNRISNFLLAFVSSYSLTI